METLTKIVKKSFDKIKTFTQPAFIYFKLTTETLDQGVKYVQS